MSLKRVLALSLILISIEANLTLTVSCETCTITCGFLNCFRLKGNGIDTQACSQIMTCNTSNSFIMKITNSTMDTTGTICPSGLIAYFPSPLPFCVSGTCPNQYTVSIQCGTCVYNLSCSKCQQTVYNGIISQQYCIGSTCGTVGATNETTGPCTDGIDVMGNKCSCCRTAISTNSTGGLSSCIQYVQFLNNDKVKNWYSTSNNNTQLKKIAFFTASALLAFIIF